MTFFDRYKHACQSRGVDPCGQRMADEAKTTRANISQWRSNGTAPKGSTVALIADALNVSTDYLLGRTDDPVDYATFHVSSPNAAAVRAVTQAVAANDSPAMQMFDRLTDADKNKVEGFMAALLADAKYQKKKQA